MSVLVDRKPEGAVQAKIKDIENAKKNIFPVDWKPERAIQTKVRDFKRIERKYIQKKAMTMWSMIWESASIEKMMTSVSNVFEGLYPSFCFGSSPVMLSPMKGIGYM
jgi:hypothetical protein